MSKTKVLMKLARKRKLKVVEYRLRKRNPVDGTGIPITDGKAIFWRTPQSFYNFQRAIEAHERAHKTARNRYKWNLACDYVINDMLRQWQGIPAPECPEPFKGKTANQIYDILMQEMG